MAGKTFVTQKRKKMGRPVTVDADKVVTLRVPGSLLTAVEAFADREAIKSRGKAIRLLIERGLAAPATEAKRGRGK